MKTEGKLARERKFYVVLPIIALPFVAILFWLLGGGTNANGQENDIKDIKSLNMELPGAKNDNSPMDKLSYYELAEKDSAKLLEQIRNDTNYRSGINGNYYPYGNNGMGQQGYGDPMSNQIYQGLNNLERQMQQGYSQNPGRWQEYDNYGSQNPYEGRMSGSGGSGASSYAQNTNSIASEPDPEIDQLNSMLDKIMEIQNPELANERLKETTQKRRGEIFAVVTLPRKGEVTLLDENNPKQSNSGFYTLDESGFSNIPQNAIRAVIHEDQVLVNGSTVKMRLVDGVYINGVQIPKDNFLFGTAQLSGERLVIKIETIRYKNSLYPIDLAVYDLDGLDGVYIPGSITRDAVKQSADRPLQSLDLGSLNPSWGAQAAGAGVEMVKGLFSKKAKLIKVKVKAGYQILLRDEKQKQSFGG